MPLAHPVLSARMFDRAPGAAQGLKVYLRYVLQDLLLQRQLRHQTLQTSSVSKLKRNHADYSSHRWGPFSWPSATARVAGVQRPPMDRRQNDRSKHRLVMSRADSAGTD